MTIYKAYKFKVYPTSQQANRLDSFLNSSKYIYNTYLYKNKDNKFFNVSLEKKTLALLCKENEWLKEVDSTILRTTLEDLDNAYERWNKGLGGKPRYKKRNSTLSYRTTCIRSSYKGKDYANIKIDLNRRTIKLPKISEIEIRGYRKLSNFPYKIVNVTVTKEAGDYYALVCTEQELTDKEYVLRNAVGLDLGVKSLVTTSDGVVYSHMDKISKYEKKLKGLNKWLARKEAGSKNRYKVIKKIQKVNKKLKNLRKFTVHQITNEIVKANDLITVETLHVKEMIEKGTSIMAKYITHSVFGEIVRQLDYKSKWLGKKLIKLNTYYASSQICNHCGHKNKKVKDLNVRVYECERCRAKLERDLNASININYEGIVKYYKEQLNN